jgi:hypothetical protein
MEEAIEKDSITMTNCILSSVSLPSYKGRKVETVL